MIVSKAAGVFASQIGRKTFDVLDRRCVRTQCRASGDDPEFLRRVVDSKPRAQPPDQKCDLRTLCTAIHVRFVENEHQAVAVLSEPLPRLVENRPLERPHQHVFEHRVVGDEDVGRMAWPRSRAVDHLVASQKFAIFR